MRLSIPKEDDAPNVTARRKTCEEVAALIDAPIGNFAPTAWRIWGQHNENAALICPQEEKGRYIAIAATAQREFEELRND